LKNIKIKTADLNYDFSSTGVLEMFSFEYRRAAAI
jgi:hypothetical protein